MISKNDANAPAGASSGPETEKTSGGNSFNEWALVELFGHQRIVGKVSEATLAGGAFLRVDVPGFNGEKAFTRFYGPSAIYSLSPVTEEIARGLMTQYRNEPVSRFDLPQIAEKVQSEDHCKHGVPDHLFCAECDQEEEGE